MKMRKTKMILIAVMTLCMLLTAMNAMAETVQAQDTAAMNQKLDATYTLALNAINKEDYATARKYLNINVLRCTLLWVMLKNRPVIWKTL